MSGTKPQIRHSASSGSLPIYSAPPKVSNGQEFKGWLYKWTNYIKGYQKRWFVLQDGVLKYYRNQADVSGACRGSMGLVNALIHTHDACCFVLSNGTTKTLHLKSSSEVERQKWVVALEVAKARAINKAESEDECDTAEPYTDELSSSVNTLTSKVHDLKTCCELVNKHSTALQKALAELEKQDECDTAEPYTDELSSSVNTLTSKVHDLKTCCELVNKHSTALQKALAELEKGGGSQADTIQMIKSVNERASIFRITTTAMIGACNDYVAIAEHQGSRLSKLVQHELDQRQHLEELVEQLGRQHCSLERKIRRSIVPGDTRTMALQEGGSDDDDDDDFYDASDMPDSETLVQRRQSRAVVDTPDGTRVTPPPPLRTQQSGDSVFSLGSGDSNTVPPASLLTQKSPEVMIQSPSLMGGKEGLLEQYTAPPVNNTMKQRRTTIPEKPNVSLSVWNVMKNCIGKELSKIPFPVNFSEPISFLQRLTEDFEYSSCLDKAAQSSDSSLQMAYVAAFTVSSYANTTLRTGKPFNPLLGETYECDRTSDYGWRSVAEQVSHHPPMVSMYTEGRGWIAWQEFTMSSKFRGKYLQIIPLGIAHLLFPQSGNHYTWRKVTTTIHNIIVGNLWVDNHGEMDIVNHNNGETCHLKYSSYSYFSKETPRKVSGLVVDGGGVARYTLNGMWDNKLEGSRIIRENKNSGKSEYDTEPPVLLWQRVYRPDKFEKCYNFTQFAVELNEMEPHVAPTDSRFRPDQRLMELGQWDKANEVKIKLEEKQREKRKRRESVIEEVASRSGSGSLSSDCHGYQPKWFQQDTDPQTGNLIHIYTGEYWQCKDKQDWSRCPDIYM